MKVTNLNSILRITYRKHLGGEILIIKTKVIMDYFEGFILEILPAICFPYGL